MENVVRVSYYKCFIRIISSIDLKNNIIILRENFGKDDYLSTKINASNRCQHDHLKIVSCANISTLTPLQKQIFMMS